MTEEQWVSAEEQEPPHFLMVEARMRDDPEGQPKRLILTGPWWRGYGVVYFLTEVSHWRYLPALDTDEQDEREVG